MGMGRLDEKCSLLIKRCRAGRLSLLFIVQQSFRPIGSLGCVGCSIALCLSSQHNAIGFPARCVCHCRLSLLSSLPVAFVIFACRFCHLCLSLLSSLPVLFGAVSFCGVSRSCFLVDFTLVRSFVLECYRVEVCSLCGWLLCDCLR